MELYKEYIEVQKLIDSLEEKKDSLRKKISDELPEEGYKDETVNAYWTTKKTWKYPAKIDLMTENLKLAKLQTEHDGTAEGVEVKQLTIKVK